MSEDLATLLLHLRLRAFASTEALVADAGLDAAEALTLLELAAADRLVQHRGGRVLGWSLTAAGRTRGEQLLAAELDATGFRDTVVEAYLDFLPLNAELLSICTDWQVVEVDGDHVPNDHADPLRDAAVLARLDALHPEALRLTATLAGADARFDSYGPRLAEAHRHIVAGRSGWLTRVTGSSYHGVWFELHEHLLAVLGRVREHEAVPAGVGTDVRATSSRPPAGRGPGTGDLP